MLERLSKRPVLASAAIVALGLTAASAPSEKQEAPAAVVVEAQQSPNEQYRFVHHVDTALATGYCSIRLIAAKSHMAAANRYVAEHNIPTEQCPEPTFKIVASAPYAASNRAPKEAVIGYDPNYAGSYGDCVAIPQPVANMPHGAIQPAANQPV